MVRFELLKKIPEILRGMKFYQEYQSIKKLIEVKKNKQTFLEYKEIQYWAFIAIMNNTTRVKIIIRQIGQGNKILWSIIPAWRIKGYKNIRQRILHHGNLEQD